MSRDEEIRTPTLQAGLSPLADARAVVKLVQCSQCSYLLREPMTLPCGNCLCTRCIPALHKRENISYPQIAGRSEGFVCPFEGCGQEHAVGDCSVDITASKLMDVIESHMTNSMAHTTTAPALRLDERLHWPNVIGTSMDIMPRSRVLTGGRILASYKMAEMGELHYDSGLAYTHVDQDQSETVDALDIAVLECIKDSARSELECQVCYGLMLDPITTTCGHTFCRRCVQRILDHSDLCPMCRRRLLMPPGVHTEPTNKRISAIIEALLPNELATRRQLDEQEHPLYDDTQMPLFPCTLGYPIMPTFLHIFEPRYRLMVRRCIDSGSRRFGIVMHNRARQPQGFMGNAHFMEYGTVLHVNRLEMFRDGRSLLETHGVYRFRVLSVTERDGYLVGRIQRVDDMSLADEEALEARETTTHVDENAEPNARFEHMPTQELLQYCLDFIGEARSRSTGWLHDTVLAAYGQPPTDAAHFPYWFASVLPIAEDEKYTLLPTTSVRERLKITARWIQRLEDQRCALRSALARRSVLDSSSEDEDEPEAEAAAAPTQSEDRAEASTSPEAATEQPSTQQTDTA